MLLVTGAPLAAALLVPLAEALARDFTVVTYDSPGVPAGAADNSVHEPAPDLEADAAVALLNVLGPEPADVFGSCVGAVAGLGMVARHPGRLRTLVAHEPPLPELLPGAAELRARIDDVAETLHHEGVEAAWRKFMTTPEFHTSDATGCAAPPGLDVGQDFVIDAGSHDDEMRRVRYLPDASLLKGWFDPGCRWCRRGLRRAVSVFLQDAGRAAWRHRG